MAVFLYLITIIIMKKINPTILKGTREFLPAEMAKRNLVMNQMKQIFERFGYGAVETPILCPAETILGKYGDEGTKLTYSFEDNGGRKIALPYDLTVPFARLVAANWGTIPMPFKRYQIQRVWRADKPQKGRYREFYQCDIDIIGTRNLVCEAEVAKVVVTVFKELGFDKFTIKLNSRRLLNNILESFDVSNEKAAKVIQAIDKLAKIGDDAVIEIIENLGVKDAEEIIILLKPAATNAETFEKLAAFDLSEMREFFYNCKAMDVPEKYLQFDPSLARGLDYYTGISYEVYVDGCDFGALCAGGRYDNLCSMFCDKEFSGVGVAFGFGRIVLALEEMGKLENVQTGPQVLITQFDEELSGESLKLYSELIKGGIKSELYFEPCKLSKQFKYADKKEIPFVLTVGPEEMGKAEVTVKNMKTGKQKAIARKQIISYLNNYYEA